MCHVVLELLKSYKVQVKEAKHLFPHKQIFENRSVQKQSTNTWCNSSVSRQDKFLILVHEYQNEMALFQKDISLLSLPQCSNFQYSKLRCMVLRSVQLAKTRQTWLLAFDLTRSYIDSDEISKITAVIIDMMSSS